ncbi:mucin-2-like [Lampris incognitus]|uniref:mucin-2-like n=1 Tax=Lampris incognitus TaxID=2546036 RepID=UPI0024B4DBB3|nr:mucin-2-like [Lampris incognitus]
MDDYDQQEPILESDNEALEHMGRVDEGVEEFFTKRVLPADTLKKQDEASSPGGAREEAPAGSAPCPPQTRTLRRKLGDFFTLRKRRGLKSEPGHEGRPKKASIADLIRPLREAARAEKDKEKEKMKEHERENEKEKEREEHGAGTAEPAVQGTPSSGPPALRADTGPPRRALRDGKSQSLILLSGSATAGTANNRNSAKKNLDGQNSFEQKLHLMFQRIGVSKAQPREAQNPEGEMKKAESEGTIIESKAEPPPTSTKPRTMSTSSDTRHQIRPSASAHESAGKPALPPKPVIKPGPAPTASGRNTPENELAQIQEGETCTPPQTVTSSAPTGPGTTVSSSVPDSTSFAISPPSAGTRSDTDTCTASAHPAAVTPTDTGVTTPISTSTKDLDPTTSVTTTVLPTTTSLTAPVITTALTNTPTSITITSTSSDSATTHPSITSSATTTTTTTTTTMTTTTTTTTTTPPNTTSKDVSIHDDEGSASTTTPDLSTKSSPMIANGAVPSDAMLSDATTPVCAVDTTPSVTNAAQATSSVSTSVLNSPLCCSVTTSPVSTSANLDSTSPPGISSSSPSPALPISKSASATTTDNAILTSSAVCDTSKILSSSTTALPPSDSTSPEDTSVTNHTSADPITPSPSSPPAQPLTSIHPCTSNMTMPAPTAPPVHTPAEPAVTISSFSANGDPTNSGKILALDAVAKPRAASPPGSRSPPSPDCESLSQHDKIPTSPEGKPGFEATVNGTANEEDEKVPKAKPKKEDRREEEEEEEEPKRSMK